MTPLYITLLFVTASSANGLPPGLLSAVCWTESQHNPAAHNQNDGGSPSLGMCQVKLATARLLGFKGSSKTLSLPSENIFWAAKYLSLKLKIYHGDVIKAVSAYNAGRHRYNKKGVTMNKKYVSKVMKAWAGIK